MTASLPLEEILKHIKRTPREVNPNQEEPKNPNRPTFVSSSNKTDFGDGSLLHESELENETFSLLFSVTTQRGKWLSAEGINQFVDELRHRYPCTPPFFRRSTWTLEEAGLIYYGINPDILNDLPIDDKLMFLQPLFALIDSEKVYENFVDYIKLKQGIPFLRLTVSIPIEVFYTFLQEKSYPIPPHFPNRNQQDESPKIEEKSANEKTPLFAPKVQALFEKVKRTRGNAIHLALDSVFKTDKDAMTSHLTLIAEFNTPPLNEFEQYAETTHETPLLLFSHRCRAVGKLLKHLFPQLKVKELYEHEVIKGLQMTIKKEFTRKPSEIG